MEITGKLLYAARPREVFRELAGGGGLEDVKNCHSPSVLYYVRGGSRSRARKGGGPSPGDPMYMLLPLKHPQGPEEERGASP